MKYLHSQKIVSRDLKPQNVLLDNNYYPHICDFGASKKLDTLDSQNYMNTGIGTLLYMAPEIWTGSQYTYKVDIFSYAIVAYELITNKNPIPENENPMSFLYQVPDISMITDQFQIDFLQKCWSNDPNQRPTFSDIVDILKNEKFFSSFGIDEEEVNEYLNIFDDQNLIEKSKHEESDKLDSDNSKSIENEKTKLIGSENSEMVDAKPIQSMNSKETDSMDPKILDTENSKSIENERLKLIESENSEMIDTKPIRSINSKEIDSKYPKILDTENSEMMDFEPDYCFNIAYFGDSCENKNYFCNRISRFFVRKDFNFGIDLSGSIHTKLGDFVIGFASMVSYRKYVPLDLEYSRRFIAAIILLDGESENQYTSLQEWFSFIKQDLKYQNRIFIVAINFIECSLINQIREFSDKNDCNFFAISYDDTRSLELMINDMIFCIFDDLKKSEINKKNERNPAHLILPETIILESMNEEKNESDNHKKSCLIC